MPIKFYAYLSKTFPIIREKCPCMVLLHFLFEAWDWRYNFLLWAFNIFTHWFDPLSFRWSNVNVLQYNVSARSSLATIECNRCQAHRSSLESIVCHIWDRHRVWLFDCITHPFMKIWKEKQEMFVRYCFFIFIFIFTKEDKYGAYVSRFTSASHSRPPFLRSQ